MSVVVNETGVDRIRTLSGPISVKSTPRQGNAVFTSRIIFNVLIAVVFGPGLWKVFVLLESP